MGKRVAVVNGNSREREELCAALGEHTSGVAAFASLSDFDRCPDDFEAAIFDLNSLPVTNEIFQKYSKTIPRLQMIAVSGRTFHPELRESMATCLLACLAKPVDINELVYLLKGI